MNPAPVAISPLLVCFAQSKLPSDGSHLAWTGIKTLHKSLPTENQKLINCQDTIQMLVARLRRTSLDWGQWSLKSPDGK